MASPSLNRARNCSILAIAHFEMRWAAQVAAALLHPMRRPAEHRLQRRRRRAERRANSRRISQQRGGGFVSCEYRRTAEQLTELHRDLLYRESLRPAQVEGGRRCRQQGKRAQDHFVRVALPNAIERAIG